MQGLELLDDYEFVAIFDADFKPDADFLVRMQASCFHADLVKAFLCNIHSDQSGVLQMATVPYLIDNPKVGFVQARWVFANPDESYLTKAQEISLNFHCRCEQLSTYFLRIPCKVLPCPCLC